MRLTVNQKRELRNELLEVYSSKGVCPVKEWGRSWFSHTLDNLQVFYDSPDALGADIAEAEATDTNGNLLGVVQVIVNKHKQKEV